MTNRKRTLAEIEKTLPIGKKKPNGTVRGMFYSDRCNFCGDLGQNIEPWVCDLCRDKIFDWINQHGWTLLQTEKPNKDIGDFIREKEESDKGKVTP